MKHLFILTILVYFGISCNRKTAFKSEGFKSFVTDTTKHISYNEIDFSILRAKEFNLPEIHKGVDSFELRIWVSSMMIPDFATILRYSDSQWVAYEYAYYETGKVLDSVIIKKINLVDSIGNVVAYLSNTKILELPSQYAIPGFIDNVADGQSCALEISTKTFYKALHYHCPEHFSDPINKKFMSVVTYLNSYLHFYLPICLPSK